MKYLYKIIFLFILLSLSVFYVSAQVSQKALPRTMRAEYIQSNMNKKIALPVFNMKTPSTDSIIAQINKEKSDCKDCRAGKTYGMGQTLNVDLLKVSTQEKTTEGIIYRYQIKAEKAKGLQIYFEEFKVPVGGELYVYNQDHSMTLGAFTNANNTDGGNFVLQVIRGSSITIEYFQPFSAPSNATHLKVKDVVYCYADIFGVERSGDGIFGTNPNVDISCLEDVQCYFDNAHSDWKNVSSSVGLLTSYNPGAQIASAIGTGTLMNNTAQNQKPYFLTALHIHYASWALKSNDNTQFITYFNHQKEYCGQDPNSVQLTSSIYGASKITIYESGDMALLLLHEQPPMEYNLTYAGWENFDNVAKVTGPYKGIHHPGGSLKKINTGSQLQESTFMDYAGTGTDSWYVIWETGNTQKGSSGSPLFNNNKQVIGFL